MPHEIFRFAGYTLTELAQIAGNAPTYVYSRDAISQKIRDVRNAFPDKVRLHYSIKANPHALTVAHIAHQVDGADVASQSEMLLAIGSGLKPENISFSGPGKSDIELMAAITAGIVLHVESIYEIERIFQLTHRMHHRPRIALRINPDFVVKQSGMVMGGGAQPFGIDLDQVDSALRLLTEKGLACSGLHCYAGSQMLNAGLVCDLQEQTLNMMMKIIKQHHLTNVSLNLGGGFGIPYFKHDQPLNIKTVAEHLSEILDRYASNPHINNIIIELGRYLVAESGLYVVRVVDKKSSRGKKFLVVEGGMNHHLAATGNLGQAIRRNFPVVANANGLIDVDIVDVEMETVNIVGPLCTPLDILASDVILPVLQPGDHIAILNSGAYGYSASPHGFLSHSPPVELLL